MARATDSDQRGSSAASRLHTISRIVLSSAHPRVPGCATAEGTQTFLEKKQFGGRRSLLGCSGLSISPVGFGCHRLDDFSDQRSALEVAIKVGCNLIDVAPNYSDGGAERAVGAVLQKLFAEGQARRNEIVVVGKVGNITGSSLRSDSVSLSKNIARVRDNAWHCIDPTWIEIELSGSLDRLGLQCIDVLLLHCPEFASRAEGVDMEEVYRRMCVAFDHLEKEVERGRIVRYGVTAAFYPLRPSDSEHLLLHRVLSSLPRKHHFEVLQFPLNFAEPNALWAAHTLRDRSGAAVDVSRSSVEPPLLSLAKELGLATLVNRPLDGIYNELRGVVRFASEVPFNGELQEEDVDGLEEKLTELCSPSLGDIEDPVTAQLASKTIKVLVSLEGVDCVLVGMRRVEYIADIVRLFETTPSLDAATAQNAVRRMHDTLNMWLCANQQEEDHGTARDWRLPARSQ